LIAGGSGIPGLLLSPPEAARCVDESHSPPVMKAVDDIGYHGWAITEQGGGDSPAGLKDLCQRLEKILAT
jgi:hypothetical protein